MPEFNPVKARLIIEMLGSPKEHVTSTLQKYLEKLKRDGMQLAKERIEEPAQKGELWATHAQFEAEFPTPGELVEFCFDAMPSSIEILAPEALTLKQKNFEDFLNDLQARLHMVDMQLKKARAEIQLLDKNAVNVFRNFIAYAVKNGANTDGLLSKALGVPIDVLNSFTDIMIREKKLIKENGTYRLTQ